MAILPSCSAPSGNRLLICGSTSQPSTTRATTGTSRFSGRLQGPEAPITLRALTPSKLLRPTFCTAINIPAETGMPTITIGRPNLSQSTKSICMPSVLLIRPTAMALVGLPTRVPSPPIEAAKATPMISAPAKPPVSFSCDHEGEQYAPGAFPGKPDDRQREALVQANPLDRQRQKGTAEDQEQDRRIIFAGCVGGAHHAHGRQGEKRQQRGGGQRDRLGHPPDCHQDGQGGDIPGGRGHRGRSGQEQHGDEQGETRP